MIYLQDIKFSKNECGIELVIRLNDGWQEPAKKFPLERITEVLQQSISFARLYVGEYVELRTDSEYGLTGISLPNRCGTNLQKSQDCYVSHNLTKPEQVLAVLSIAFDYLKLLENL